MLSEHGIDDARGLMLNDPESEWHLRAPAAGDGTPLAHSAPPVSPSLGGAIRLLLWVTGLGYHQGEEIGAEDSCCSIIMQYHAFSCIICRHESSPYIFPCSSDEYGPSMSITRIIAHSQIHTSSHRACCQNMVGDAKGLMLNDPES